MGKSSQQSLVKFCCSRRGMCSSMGHSRCDNFSTVWHPRCRTLMSNSWIAVLLICCCVTVTYSLDVNDVQGYLRNLEVPSDTEHNEYSQDVDIGPSWGIEDTAALVGKVFKYSIPKDLFHKETTSLKVTEKGKNLLPYWLDFDEEKSILKGVPGAAEVGKEVYIEVVPNGDKGNKTRDVFSIKVQDGAVHTESAAVPVKNVKNDEELKPIKCPHGSSITMATVMVDTDVSILRPSDRVDMMESMCHHLGMPTELVRLQPVGNRPLFDSLALVAGPGDIKQPQHTGAMVQWEVGCGNVFANHMPVLQQLENTAHDGTMSKSVGHGIIGWHVTNNKPQAAKRVKRQAYLHATHTPHILPPLPTKQPGETIKGDKTEGPGVPPTRTIPSLSTPEFPEIKPTHTDHHHHHHTRGPKTHGRHPDHTTSIYEVPQASKPHKSVMATPTTLPIVPTKVIDMPSSAAPPTGDFIQPSEETTSPGISRSDAVIEPSMTSSYMHPTAPTDVLPTRTYPMPSMSTTEPVKPTHTDTITPPTKVTPTDKPVTRYPPQPPIVPTEEDFDFNPKVHDEGLGRIETFVGDILDLEIPADNFDDYEDGNTRNMALTLTTIDNMDLPPDSWLRLDHKNQRLYGFPLLEHMGKHAYLLSAIDSSSHIVKDAFEIDVRRRPGEHRINHEMSMQLQLNYHKFLLDVEQRIDVARKLVKAYGDKDMSTISVTNIAPGSVVYSWTNKTLPVDECPESTLLALTRRLVTANGSMNPEFKTAMKPYKVNNAKVEFKGTCGHMPSVSTKPQEGGGIVEGPGDGVATQPKTSEEDVWVTTVAPAVVIAAMLLLGALIACILYRKRRKGKLSDEDQHTFIQKGIPIILPDELEEKPDPPTKPLIMADEKPPQPPPEYPHSPSPSTPRSDHKEPLIDTEDDEPDHHSPLYRPPPPPATGSLGHRNSRPHTPVAQRSPPQYMSPISA